MDEFRIRLFQVIPTWNLGVLHLPGQGNIGAYWGQPVFPLLIEEEVRKDEGSSTATRELHHGRGSTVSRSYRKVRPHDSMVYSVAEVQALFGVCRNTISNWVSAGLTPSDAALPQLFRGAELKRFHAERAARTRRNLRPGEFKCVGCGNAVVPDLATLSLQRRKGQATLAHATCCDCGATVLKLLGATECDKVQDCIATKTPLTLIDERQQVCGQGVVKNVV